MPMTVLPMPVVRRSVWKVTPPRLPRSFRKMVEIRRVSTGIAPLAELLQRCLDTGPMAAGTAAAGGRNCSAARSTASAPPSS